MEVRSFEELAGVEDPAWPEVLASIEQAPVPARVLEPTDGPRTLYALQVTARSTLGALALNAGAILIDHGWVRLLGGGAPGLPSLAEANQLADPASVEAPPPLLTIGFDVLGGRFAIDGGGLGIGPGEVCYWAPDSLEWEGLDVGHSDFVHKFLLGATTEFYGDYRWAGWEAEVAALDTDQGLMTWPPLSSREGKDLSRVSREPIPFEELSRFLHGEG